MVIRAKKENGRFQVRNETVAILHFLYCNYRKLVFVTYLCLVGAWKGFLKRDGTFFAKIKPTEKWRDLQSISKPLVISTIITLFTAFPVRAGQSGGRTGGFVARSSPSSSSRSYLQISGVVNSFPIIIIIIKIVFTIIILVKI